MPYAVEDGHDQAEKEMTRVSYVLITKFDLEEKQTLKRIASNGYGGISVLRTYKGVLIGKCLENRLCYRSTGRLKPIVYKFLTRGNQVKKESA